MNPKVLITAGFLLLMSAASAQLKSPFGSAFRSDVQKVVEDYPHQFASIRGEVVVKNPQSVEYSSLLTPQGVEASSIVQYSSVNKAIYSWQATVLTTESFEEAQKKYKWLYQQLKGMNVKYVADLYTLRGAYEEPSESRKFTTSVLTLQAPPTPLQKLKVEVSMDFEFPEWKVSLMVYEKEREDDEHGSIYEQ
jgi:hypothetical protein